MSLKERLKQVAVETNEYCNDACLVECKGGCGDDICPDHGLEDTFVVCDGNVYCAGCHEDHHPCPDVIYDTSIRHTGW